MDSPNEQLDASKKTEDEEASENIPENAFLITQGNRSFPLKHGVISIGRRLDKNDLVLDDPRVSRYHAQLRLIGGQYILFDLESTGGTYVNGQRIKQSVIYSGDVISLAGVEVVFKLSDAPSRPDLKETAPF